MKLSERLNETPKTDADGQSPATSTSKGRRQAPSSQQKPTKSASEKAKTGSNASTGRAATNGSASGSAASKGGTAKKKGAAKSGRAEQWLQTKKRVHELIVADLGPMLSKRNEGLDLAAEVRSRLDDALANAEVEVTQAQRSRFVAEVTADILGYGPLEPYLSDPDVSEVMVNAYDDIFVERAGRLERTDASFSDERQLRQVIDRIVASVGRRVDESSPLCDARLPDGSRVNVVLPPLALRGPALTIRKFPEAPMRMGDLVEKGSLSQQLSDFLDACVKGKLNVLVTGGTGTGKTTLLNAVSQCIPLDDRIVTIEDAAELRLNQPHVVPMEARPANAEGEGLIAIRELVRNALRMRPDRIVVGEVRGPEALDMLQAMNTGHEGSLTTLHANSPRDALSRLETMVLMAGMDLTLRAIRDQVASAIDLIVHLDRLGDGRRIVTKVSEVQGMEGEVIVLQDLFAYRFDTGGSQSSASTGALAPTGLRPKCLIRLEEAGLSVPPSLFADLPTRQTRQTSRRRARS